MEHTVVCRNVSKVYRQDAVAVQALTDINLEIPRLDFVCLSGPSGSGKSTLLGLLAGLDSPSSGTVFLDGTDIFSFDEDSRARLRGRLAGFVFQSFALLPTYSAAENIDLMLRLAGIVGRHGRERRVRAVLALVGFRNWADHRP